MTTPDCLAPHPKGPCWHCTGYGGLVYQRSAARCTKPGHPAIRTEPHQGCSGWVRAPGTDDTPDDPAGYHGRQPSIYRP